MKKALLIFMSFAVLYCSHRSGRGRTAETESYQDRNLIRINPEQTYPEFKVPLAQLADVYYFGFKDAEEDSFYFGLVPDDCCVDWERRMLIIKTSNLTFPPQMRIFDWEGNVIRKIDLMGKEPGQLASFGGLQIAVNCEKEEIIIFSPGEKRFVRYNYDGEYVPYEKEFCPDIPGFPKCIIEQGGKVFVADSYDDAFPEKNPVLKVFDESSMLELEIEDKGFTTSGKLPSSLHALLLFVERKESS